MKKVFGLSNFKKAYRYCRKNGIVPAFWAALERIAGGDTTYEKRFLSAAELEMQRDAVWDKRELFSVLVPAYETDVRHFHEMIDSVQAQTYGNWELIIADASPSDKLRREMGYYKDSRIRYLRLKENRGISENTNAALAAAAGGYIGLLDHDDVLEPDALYRMMETIQGVVRETGIAPQVLYSDEDKCDETGQYYYEPNIKSNFNFDFLLSNNYICHFLLMKAELIKELGLRPAYDGAQDYDLILRAVGRLQEKEIVHVGRILYHWRCHALSTAANPASKLYAYEAGKRAVQDFLREKGIEGQAVDTEHVGFYRIVYEPDIFAAREDVGMLGGSVTDRDHKRSSGILLKNGLCPFAGLYSFFSGPANVAAVGRDAYALDARAVLLRKEDIPLFEEIMKVPYVEEIEKRDRQYCNRLDENIWKQRSMALCAVFRERGQRLVWDPKIRVRR